MKTHNLTLARLTCANLAFKPLTSLFNILLLAMGIAIILTLAHLNEQIENRFSHDLKGIDLVVSGKGSPLQVILSSVFQLDIPTGNIPLAEADKLKANPLVKSAIPLAMGDNYNGFRIVGSSTDYIAHYGAKLADGRLYTAPMEAVLGSEVARKYNLKTGDHIVGAHGLVNSDDLHSNFPYTITGILLPTGGVIDRLVITPVESVWCVHEHPDADDAEEVAYKKEHPEKEITALLVTYSTPYAAAQLPRLVNKSSSMQAASPAFEVARLNQMMGAGGEAIAAFGYLLVAFAAFSLFITLYNAINERQYDLGLMRCLGATRGRIFGFVLCEAAALGLAGCIAGILLAQIFIRLAAFWIASTKHVILETGGIGLIELETIAGAMAISLMAGFVPAIRAYRMNIVKVLARA